MVTFQEIALSLSVFLTPPARKMEKREQWLADFRDCAEMDVEPNSLAAGIISSSITLRLHHFGAKIAHSYKSTKETGMKISIAVAAVGCLTVGAALASVNAVQSANLHSLETTHIDISTIPESWLGESHPDDFIAGTEDPASGTLTND